MVCQLLTCDIDNPEPVQLLTVRPVADIDEQGIVQNLVLLVFRQIIEILVINGERTVNILTQGDSALLSVKHLIAVSAVILLNLAPVDNIQRQAL